MGHPGVLSAGAPAKDGQGAMPSERYYRERTRTLLAWARATKDKAYAAHLRLRAANELEQAQQAREAVADLTSLPSEFHARQMQKED
jgi:hypothetical protein